uniref:transmembrane protein 65 isoform X2 n=1 Tax=Myxine glutinosa TaxID=7769 RepID=UPI00358E71E0
MEYQFGWSGLRVWRVPPGVWRVERVRGTSYTGFSVPSAGSCSRNSASSSRSQQRKMQVDAPTTTQLRHVFIHNAVPFVGFGLLDNCIMITAGTKIELSFGVILSISTMAAAALGNLVSDLAGLGLAGYVEVLAGKVGFPGPHLTPKQTDMWQTRVTSHLGRALGITVGCLFGMFPLLFLSDHEDDKNSLEKQDQ